MNLLGLLTLISAFTFTLSKWSCGGTLGEPNDRCSLDGYHQGDRSTLQCSDAISEEELMSSIARCTDKRARIKYIVFQNISARYIPKNVFQGLRFMNEVEITLRNCSIQSLSDRDIAFEGLENYLRRLVIFHGTFMDRWDWSVLKSLEKLRTINALYGDIQLLDYSMSKLALGSLEKVYFRFAHISGIDDHAFANMSGLVEIFLNYNDISELKRSMFPNPANRLRSLQFANNELSDLPTDLFTNMPNLRSIVLTGNRFVTLRESTFAPVWTDLSLYVYSPYDPEANPISCDCRLKWILEKPKNSGTVRIRCQSPESLERRDLMDLNTGDLWC